LRWLRPGGIVPSGNGPGKTPTEGNDLCGVVLEG